MQEQFNITVDGTDYVIEKALIEQTDKMKTFLYTTSIGGVPYTLKSQLSTYAIVEGAELHRLDLEAELHDILLHEIGTELKMILARK